MADSPTLPLTGSGDATVRVSTEEITTLNGGAVSAEHVQRVVQAARTANGTAVDIGHAEDAAHATGDAGVMMLAVRKDTAAALAGTDGDYAPLEVDASGRLHVAPHALLAADGVDIGNVDVATVPAPLSTTGGGTEATALRVTVASDSTGVLSVDDNGGSLTVDGTVTATIAAGATTIAKAEDVASADADVGVPAMMVRKATPANTSGTDGDYEMLQGSAGRLWTSATIDAALPAGTNAIGKLAANSGVDIGDVDVASIAAGDNNIGNVDIVTVPAPLSTTGGGTEATALRVTVASDSTGVLSVDDNGGSLTVDGTITANAGTGTRNVAGDVAHDSADSGGGGPIKIGGKARTTNPTAVADADRVDATFDDIGRQVVVLNQVRDLVVHQHTQIASSAAETTIVTAGAAGVFHDLTHLIITNQTATAVNVTIKDATAGTTRMIIALAASGGAVIPFPVPAPQASAANNWTATLSSAAVTVNIYAQAVKNV